MKFDIKKHIYLILLFILSFTVETAQSQEVTNIHIAATDTVPTYTSDSAVINFLKDAGIPITQNSKLKLLKSGRAKFIDLFEEIRHAKHHIHLEYFNFRNDSIANALFDLLGEKVKEGVEVRALFDAFGNLSNNKPLKKKHIQAIRDKGIEIVKFDPFKFPYINHALHRDHRKIVVIDGKIGYTGGMNIANYYIKGLPEIGDWRDMHIRIEGNAVNELQDIFLAMWNKSTKQHVSGSQYYPLRNDSTFKGNKNVAIVDRIPKKEPRLMRQTYIKSIDAAQDKIQIVNPYFTPIPSIKKAIKRALKRGVEVEIMIPSNNKPLKKKHIQAIRDKGIEIVKFDPFKFPYINHALHRDHRKIVVIDGKIGYTGGMNIANYYIKGLPEIGDWRDMHIRIEGNAVNELQDIFLAMWNKSTKQHVSGSQYYPLRNDSTFKGNKNVAIVDRIPKKEPRLMRQTYIKSIDAAQDKIQIVNPYFTPIPSIKKAIKRALKRGVEVEIMIPGKSDIPFTPDAAFYTANKLRKKGAKIYVYNGGFHHSKIMMVDSLFCTVGSTNLNSRSLRYDYEVNAFIFDKETTHELSTMFEHDKLDSTLFTKEEYKKRSGWKRFVGWFANLFSPFL